MARLTIRDEAGEYVAEHALYMRENCYTVRYPNPYGGRCIVASCTSELADKVAKQMRSDRRRKK